MSYFFKQNKKQAGFSMLELLVVITIFLIVTGILIVDIPNFREKSSLDLTVSEVATYIRGAQVYGSAQVGNISTPVSYGVTIKNGVSDFFLLKDLVNGSGGTEEEGPYQMKNFKFDGILYKTSSPSPVLSCTEQITIVYEANSGVSSIGTVLGAKAYQGPYNDPVGFFEYADIKIKSLRGQGLTSCLRIYANGQIANISCGMEGSFDAVGSPPCD